MRYVLLLTMAVTLASCSKPKPPLPPPAPYNLEIPVNELMAHVISPAAFAFWGGAGVVSNAAGEHDLTPKTEAEWKKVEDGAATVVEGVNTLMLPGRARAPQADWYRHATKVGKLAKAGKDAAEHQDRDAVWKIGGELDEACDDCHKQFMPNYR